MMKLFTLIAILLTFFSLTNAACYTNLGCRDPMSGRRYREHQTWNPKSNPCDSCTCYKMKKIVKVCRKAIESNAPATVLKSTFTGKLLGLTNVENRVVEDEYIKVRRRRAKLIRCPPVKAPTFNYVTLKFEDISYKNIHYYYNISQSTCCSRFITYRSVHPSCKVVRVGRCLTKVVQRANPKKKCEGPMSFVG